MATQMDMNTALSGFVAQQRRGVADGKPSGQPGADTVGIMLEQLTGQIQARIEAVEQRHAEAMSNLQGKLERMSGSAGRAKPEMPSELAVAFGRIETGMADLVDRIAETAPNRRRGADAFVFGAKKPDSSHFVFNPPKREPVAPVSLNGDLASGEPWDQASAEALAHLYESGEAVLGKHLPEAALFAPGQWARSAEASGFKPAPQAIAAARIAEVETRPLPAPLLVAGLGEDRDWLDQRLASIAEQVSKSIGDAYPDGALKTLMTRVDQLESRFTSALDGIASKSDVASMRQDALLQVETQIKELAGHIESTHQQLTRLDSIEQHLSDLTAFAHASMDAEPAAAIANAGPSDHSHDFAQLADMAVERALARAPASAAHQSMLEPAETQARVDAVHALLQEFAAERRRGDHYTTGMLETVQEALIRLIDRVDAIDVAAGARAVAEQPALMPAASVGPVERSRVLPEAASAAPVARPLALDEQRVEADARAERAPKRRPQSLDEPGPAIAPQDTAAEPAVLPEINIKDLPRTARRVNITAPEKTTAPATAEVEVEAEQKPVRGVRVQAAAQVGGGAGKRSLYVAATALSLIGIGFMAQHLYFGSETPAVPASAAPLKPATEPRRATVAPAPAVQAKTPAQPPLNPPGMVIAPSRSEGGIQALPRPSATVAPSAAGVAVPAGAIGPRSDANLPRPSPRQVGDVQVPSVKGPATTPETVSDDLSMNEVDENDGSVVPVASVDAVPDAVPAGSPAGAIKPMQGLAIAPGNAANAPPQIISNFAGFQRQSNQAAASERLGSQARPASDFSQRFGAMAQPSEKAAVVPAAAIVTGSNPPPRAIAPGADVSLSDTVAETADMPPALVGPLSLRLAAAKGEPSAAFEVATRFAEGRGIKQDFKQAMVWYQRSAAKGFAIAQYRLGTLYERGLGTPVDPARARAWYKKAADQGNVKAMHNMAVLSAGNGQAAPDYAAAARWFKDAAERGLGDSQFNLGVLYENGLGIAKDVRTAYVWFALAARNGDAEATRRRDAVLTTLDAATLQSANNQIQSWHARPTDTKVNDPRVAGDQWRNHAVQMDAPVTEPQTSTAPMANMAVSQSPGPRTIKVPAQPR